MEIAWQSTKKPKIPSKAGLFTLASNPLCIDDHPLAVAVLVAKLHSLPKWLLPSMAYSTSLSSFLKPKKVGNDSVDSLPLLLPQIPTFVLLLLSPVLSDLTRSPLSTGLGLFLEGSLRMDPVALTSTDHFEGLIGSSTMPGSKASILSLSSLSKRLSVNGSGALPQTCFGTSCHGLGELSTWPGVTMEPNCCSFPEPESSTDFTWTFVETGGTGRPRRLGDLLKEPARSFKWLSRLSRELLRSVPSLFLIDVDVVDAVPGSVKLVEAVNDPMTTVPCESVPVPPGKQSQLCTELSELQMKRCISSQTVFCKRVPKSLSSRLKVRAKTRNSSRRMSSRLREGPGGVSSASSLQWCMVGGIPRGGDGAHEALRKASCSIAARHAL
mmetsp:Transcript_81927/g.190326  ORF Transcript_81927/g.190326 Transcript_81927/m.190326 type:complete len:383 (+) Transcript_81927:1216-2364(+)